MLRIKDVSHNPTLVTWDSIAQGEVVLDRSGQYFLKASLGEAVFLGKTGHTGAIGTRLASTHMGSKKDYEIVHAELSIKRID